MTKDIMTGDLRDLHTFLNTCRSDAMLPADSLATVTKCGSCRVYPIRNTQQSSNTNLEKFATQGPQNFVLSCHISTWMVMWSLQFRSVNLCGSVLPRRVLHYYVLSCLVMSWIVVFCLVMSGIIFSCLVLHRRLLLCFRDHNCNHGTSGCPS